MDIGAPFKAQSEPYTIAASVIKPDITPTRNTWLIVIVLMFAVVFVIIKLFRTKRT